jgi:hypothetical protein
MGRVVGWKSARETPALLGQRRPDRLQTGRLSVGPSKEGDGPDRSMADFFWCMMAAQRGWSIEETASELLKVSAKAQERARLHDEGYALITAQDAAAVAESGRG